MPAPHIAEEVERLDGSFGQFAFVGGIIGDPNRLVAKKRVHDLVEDFLSDSVILDILDGNPFPNPGEAWRRIEEPEG